MHLDRSLSILDLRSAPKQPATSQRRHFLTRRVADCGSAVEMGIVHVSGGGPLRESKVTVESQADGGFERAEPKYAWYLRQEFESSTYNQQGLQ